jgi:tetratricopeptide (TPR) repeat protein
MQKFTPKKTNSLVPIPCTIFLELVLAATILNCPQFLQSVQAQHSSQASSTLLSQAGNDTSVWNKNDRESFKFEQYRQAFEEHDKASRIKPNDPVVWKKRGDALRNLGRYLEATDSYKKAIQILPKSPVYWQNLGLTLYRRGFYKEAIDAYNAAVELDPDNANAWIWLGNSRRELGGILGKLGFTQDELNYYKEAVEAYNTALRLPRQYGNPNYRYNRSLALYRQGLVLYSQGMKAEADKLYEDAFKSINQSILLQPNNLLYLYHRASLLVDLRRRREALLILDNILSKVSNEQQLRVNPFDLEELENSTIRISRVYHLKGLALFELGKFLESLEPFSQAIKLDAYSLVSKVDSDWVKLEKDLGAYDSWFGIGLALKDLKRYGESLTALNNAIELYKVQFKKDFNVAIEERNKLEDLRSN